MPNKPKIFKCVKPGCSRVFTKNADFVSHHGKCVLGISDNLKCSSCGKGFSNSQYWKKHRKNCEPYKKSLLLPLAERLRMVEGNKSPSEQNESDEDVFDQNVIDGNKELMLIKAELEEEMLHEPDILLDQNIEDGDDDIKEELNYNSGSNDSYSSKSVYVYTLVDPLSTNPSYTCEPSFEENFQHIKQEDEDIKQEDEDIKQEFEDIKQEDIDEDELDEFIEEYLEDDDDIEEDVAYE